MTYTGVPNQRFCVIGFKDIFDQPVAFAFEKELAVMGDHASRILAAVLQHQKSIVNFGKNWVMTVCDS
jgi:hypothetical protein